MAGRSHPVFVSYEGSPLPSFPLRVAMGYLDLQPKQVLVGEDQIRLKGYNIPLINGELLIKFQNGQGSFPQYPFVDILRAKQGPTILKGRIVLIGANSRQSKRVNTPTAPRMAESEFIANILDNIINNTFIARPPFMFRIGSNPIAVGRDCLIHFHSYGTVKQVRLGNGPDRSQFIGRSIFIFQTRCLA